ncbi:MAG: choice-of-anchor D domain-containing protein, partial [Candidatus Acidiferrales bacterium]
MSKQVAFQQHGTGAARSRSRLVFPPFVKVPLLFILLIGLSTLVPGTVHAATSAVTLAPASFTFASQTVGTQGAAQVLTVTNSGTVTLNLVNGTFTGANPGDFSFTTNCPFALAVGASCTANLFFKPSGTGTRTATFLASDDAPDSPQSISLTGTGITATAPAVSLAPSSLTFPNQAVNTTSAAQNVTLTNTGSSSLTISSIAASALFSQTNTCPISPSTLAANGSCTISVKFSPTVAGTQNG